MIDEKRGTKITVTFDDERKLIAYFVYEENNPIEQSHICNFDYEYILEKHVRIIAKLDSWISAFFEAKRSLIDELKYKHIKLNYPYELRDALDVIHDVISDADLIMNAEVRIK